MFGSERLTGALLDRLTHPRSYPGDERRQLPSQPEPKTAKTPKNLTTQPMVDPVGPTGTSHAASLRVTQALHKAARVPPMDYRDNRQRWAESHQVVHFYAGPVVYFYSGVDKVEEIQQTRRGSGVCDGGHDRQDCGSVGLGSLLAGYPFSYSPKQMPRLTVRSSILQGYNRHGLEVCLGKCRLECPVV